MQTENEYAAILQHLYQKSLILQDTSLFHPVLKFYFIDALAHLDYTLGIYAYNIQSPKNIMAGEYLRWRIDEEKKGDRPRFGAFVEWLKAEHPESFEKLPTLWQMIYDSADPAQYRSFRIILNPDSRAPIPARFFRDAIEEFFGKAFLKSLYEEASLSTLLNEFLTRTG
ncbi:hypothetical protein [Methanosphaerula subterraneus]|jgi:hypothetical protein|uniref:hypothetical protein n=1 Tax=Methanosphaerula subterraneus TaxID=3350244 RepID=UPI003F85C5A1